MTSTKPDDDLLAFSEQLQASAGGRGRRSPLFQWMFKRASAFDQMLAELQPSWGSVAEAFKQRSIHDGAGKSPTPERTRKTWFEVRRAKGWDKKAGPEPPLAVEVAASPALPASQPIQSSDTRDAAMARMRAQFRPVTISKKQEQTNGN